MQEDIRLIDLVIELLDARIPASSRNPDIDALGQGKFRLIILNKADLADKEATRLWKAYFESKGCGVAVLDSRSRGGMNCNMPRRPSRRHTRCGALPLQTPE